MVLFEFLEVFKGVFYSKLPQRSRHYVGVPMFWQVWLYQKIRQHQNHFGTSRSSPPRSREGSLYKGKDMYVFEVQFQGVRLVIRHKGCCFVLFVWSLGNMKEVFNIRQRVRKEDLGNGEEIQRTLEMIG